MTNPRLLSEKQQKKVLLILILAVCAAVLAGCFGDSHFWPGLLVSTFYVLSLALGATVFLACHHLSNAAWSNSIRRVAEAMAGFIPWGAGTLLLILPALASIYPWAGHLEADVAAADFKSEYLTVSFFLVRMLVILGLWIWLSRLILRQSEAQESDGSLEHTRRSKVYSALFLVVFALTLVPASIDWLMSVEPHFYSTIYPIYVFSGLFVSGLAALCLVVLYLKGKGSLPHVHEGHLHSLGKLILGFSTFWAYIWLSQYLLIYYTNLPEETAYYAQRMTGGWEVLFLANLFLNWVIPFILFLPRYSKLKSNWLAAGCLILLVGHWLDLYLLVMPPLTDGLVLDFGQPALMAAFGLYFLLVLNRRIGRLPLVPTHDPYLSEGLWRDPYQVEPATPAWSRESKQSLTLATLAFAISFAAWGLVGALAPHFREVYRLTSIQTGILVAVPVLLGSLGRIPLGYLADRYGGRIVFSVLLVLTGLCSLGLSLSGSYVALLFWALLLGLAGSSFSVGVAFTSRWFRPEQQGTALGIYGSGNIGQSLAAAAAPLLLMLSGDWRLPFWVFGIMAAAFGILFFRFARDRDGISGGMKWREIVRVARHEPVAWVLSGFYFVTFGGFVALSMYLPVLLQEIFHLSLADAGSRVAGFVVVATAMRPVGGWLADRYRGAPVLAGVFALISLFALGLTAGSMLWFTIGALGCAAVLGLGNGAVFKLVPQFFPERTGIVSGLVGAAGGLGGFFPPILLGVVHSQTGSYGLAFVLLSGTALLCLAVDYLMFLRTRPLATGGTGRRNPLARPG
jgi:MFS transporter, NNP family, nitrate/nitrite transporter